jgi:hypothetical protein
LKSLTVDVAYSTGGGMVHNICIMEAKQRKYVSENFSENFSENQFGFLLVLECAAWVFTTPENSTTRYYS